MNLKTTFIGATVFTTLEDINSGSIEPAVDLTFGSDYGYSSVIITEEELGLFLDVLTDGAFCAPIIDKMENVRTGELIDIVHLTVFEDGQYTSSVFTASELDELFARFV